MLARKARLHWLDEWVMNLRGRGTLFPGGDPMANLTIEELDRVLRSWRGRRLRVEKREQGDLDRVEMDLEEVTYFKNDTIDDYVGRYVLQLQGAGTVRPGRGVAPASLPGRTFEIPLTTQDVYTLHEGNLEIRTPRAEYVLSPTDP